MAPRYSSFARLGMVTRAAVVAAGATLGVGCASNAPAPETAAAAPAFPAPSSIRPNDAAFKVAPMPASAAPAASARPLPRPSGEWAPNAAPRAWKYIVLHHSASPSGNAAAFDREHRANNGWDELGYHFVIDNGRGGPDGEVEIGPRWPKQKWGAHAKTPDNKFNDYGIGICFVGNFQDGRPTAKQMASAAKLVAWLMQTYKIPASNVIGHGDTKSTLCPGQNLSVARVRTLAEETIAKASLPQTPSPADAMFDEAARPPMLARAVQRPIDRELLRDAK